MGGSIQKGRETSVAELRRLWGSGLTLKEIGQMLNTSGSAVSKRIGRRGIQIQKRKGRPPKIKDQDLFKDMYDARVIVREMAQHFNCDPETVISHAARLGLKPRGRSRSNSITLSQYRQMRIAAQMAETAQREKRALKRVYFGGGHGQA